MEIFGYHPDLKKWTEIGNSGMFRPEMLLPMGLPKVSTYECAAQFSMSATQRVYAGVIIPSSSRFQRVPRFAYPFV